MNAEDAAKMTRSFIGLPNVEVIRGYAAGSFDWLGSFIESPILLPFCCRKGQTAIRRKAPIRNV